MMKKIFFSLFIFVSIHTLGQNPYIRSGSIGQANHDREKKTDTVKYSIFPFRSVENMIGEKIIFIPLDKFGQSNGYLYFTKTKVNDLMGWINQMNSSIYYKEFVGRIGLIKNVEKTSFSGGGKIVTVQMIDNNQFVYANLMADDISDVVPINDIDSTKTKFLNKTLWCKVHCLTTYDEATNDEGSICNQFAKPVKVIDVVAGSSNSSPVRLILQTEDGKEGFNDVNVSGTNALFKDRFFEDEFFLIDPKTIYNWSSEMWDAISNGKVTIGMTKEQVVLSYGKSTKINLTVTAGKKNEQWIYFDSYVYFENGIVTAIQNK